MITFFWILLFLLLYTYLIYPIVLLVLSQFIKRTLIKRQIYPFVTFIISAYNEEKNILDKLTNTIKLDYPEEQLEILVASDGSIDKTDETVKNFHDPRVQLIRFDGRRGKTFVQNQTVLKAKGEVIIFSDATTHYDSQAIKKIVRNFADPNIGAVGGELVYVNKNNTTVGQGNGTYWQYEKFLKQKESQISSLIGVSGCCYAVRKELYEPINTNLISDFVIAQIIYKKGKLVIYEPEAISYELTNDTIEDEFKMRVRIATRSLNGLWNMRILLNPFKYGFFSIQLISHKILRYLVPFFLFLFLIFNLIILIKNYNLLFGLIFALQIIFYACSLVGAVTNKNKTILTIPFYFTFTNAALLLGFLNFLRGKKQAIWSPFRK